MEKGAFDAIPKPHQQKALPPHSITKIQPSIPVAGPYWRTSTCCHVSLQGKGLDIVFVHSTAAAATAVAAWRDALRENPAARASRKSPLESRQKRAQTNTKEYGTKVQAPAGLTQLPAAAAPACSTTAG